MYQKNVLDFLLFNTKYPKSLIYIIKELLEDLKELPKTINNSRLSNFEEPVFKAFSMITLTNTDKLLETKEDEFIYKELENFLSIISDLLSKSTEELAKIVAYLGEIDKALNIWLIESFKLVSYINLAFNLSKKVENIANKIITFNTGVTTTSIIAINQAKFWKKQVLADGSNIYQCLVSAIEAGLISLVYPSQLAAFIDDSWDLMIPNYGN